MKSFFKSLFLSLLGFIAAIFFVCVIIGIAIAVTINSLQPTTSEIKRGSVLEINMDELITDSPRQMPLANLETMSLNETPSVSLLTAIRALEIAASDPNITAISLRMDGETQISLAIAEELRGALLKLRESSGKQIYAYAESYSQSDYYLASMADSLFIHPLGSVEWKGVAISSYYMGDLFKGLGVDVEAFRPAACRYKSAVEPYTRGSMSPESREQSQRLVDELWSNIVGEVAHARQISDRELRRIAAEDVVLNAEQAKEQQIADAVCYGDGYDAALERLGVMRNSSEAIRRVTLANYGLGIESKQEEQSLLMSNKIGVIYIDGTIIDGTSVGGNNPMVGSRSVVGQLREAANDDDIKSVILRVNSPGGSAMAADVIWREVELLRNQKPVIVSMGSYAASGGYYVSAPADIILADKYTITGSIGVYGIMVSYAEALSNTLRVNIDGATSSPSADFGSVPRALNPAERAAMMRGVDDVYSSFTHKVATGRNLPIGVVNNIAEGKVWSGTEAEACGLVDGIGGLNSALSIAIERSSLGGSDYSIVEIKSKQSSWEMVMEMFGVHIDILDNTLGRVKSKIDFLKSLERGLLMHSPEEVRF